MYQNQTVIVEILINKLLNLYNLELNDLQIGYNYNKERLDNIKDLIHIINYIQTVHSSRKELLKIVRYYE